MKPRARLLHEVLMGTKPGRHHDRKKKVLTREQELEMKAVKHYKSRKRDLLNQVEEA